MELSTATWPEIRELETDLAVLPVGSTEQHGPHAPLGTDAFTAEAVAQAGVEAYREATGTEVPVGPTVPVGIAAEHRAFDGTLWVSPDTFRAYVRETIESLASHGFDRVVVVNGHGGNIDALGEVAATVSRETDAYAVAFTWFNAVDAEEPMGHGGPLETALVSHIDGELIREAHLEAARDGGSDRWGEWVAGVNLAHDSAEFTDNGVVGDPTAASEALGADLCAQAADALCTLLEAVATRSRD
jgi:creatinine amidohydrolase